MEEYELFLNGIDCFEKKINLIKNAKKNVFLCLLNFDLNLKINKNETLKDLFLKKANQGIKFYVLTPFLSNFKFKKCNYKQIHPNINIKYINYKNTNVLTNVVTKTIRYCIFKPVNYFLNSEKLCNIEKSFICCDNNVHQRYMCVDDQKALVSNTDFFEYNINSITDSKTNKFNKYWVEYGVFFKPRKDFITYCYNNFSLDGKGFIQSDYIYGNFYHKNTEYNKILELIKNSKKSIYIENQWLNSDESTKNIIIKELAYKIVESVKNNTDFKIIIYTNEFYNDDYNRFKKFSYYYFNYKKYLSILYLFRIFYKENIDIKDIDKRLFILNNKNTNIFIHNKVFIFDSEYMLVGSSNIWERSYTPKKDLELSILLKGSKVKDSQKKLLKYCTGNYKNEFEENFIMKKIHKNFNYLKFFQNDLTYFELVKNRIIILLLIILIITIIKLNKNNKLN